MIGFFRKTRKKLADDNKPAKYLRYAIGEIVLVMMIGILLALQVNNWNEDRKMKIKEVKTLKELSSDDSQIRLFDQTNNLIFFSLTVMHVFLSF